MPDAVSMDGARFVAQFEGFFPRLYNDPSGLRNCTIGYGFLVHLGPCNGSEPSELKAGITRQRAVQLLAAELGRAADAVRRLVKVSLNQAQFDALVSFAFNVGQGALASSTLLRVLNLGDYGAVPTQLNRFVYAGGKKLSGLVRRRAAEGRLFAAGDYGDAKVS